MPRSAAAAPGCRPLGPAAADPAAPACCSGCSTLGSSPRTPDTAARARRAGCRCSPGSHLGCFGTLKMLTPAGVAGGEGSRTTVPALASHTEQQVCVVPDGVVVFDLELPEALERLIGRPPPRHRQQLWGCWCETLPHTVGVGNTKTVAPRTIDLCFIFYNYHVPQNIV